MDFAKNIYTTNKFKAGFSKIYGKHKGLEYKVGSIPQDVWVAGVMASGDPDYWRKDDYKKFHEWLDKNPQYKN